MVEKDLASRTASRSPIPPLAKYWTDEGSRRRYVDHLFDGTAGDYDFVERLLGFGTGPWYRRTALARAGLKPGMRVLDIATGTGLVAREALAIVGEQGLVVGLDPSEGMLGQAGALPMPRVRALGEQLPCGDASFDFISMGFALRHVADLDGLFTEMRRVLRPGGAICVLEITHPRRRLVAGPLRLFMTRVVPAAAVFRGRYRQARALMQFYWDTIEACVPPEGVMAALARAGFEAPRRTEVVGLFSEYTAKN